MVVTLLTCYLLVYFFHPYECNMHKGLTSTHVSHMNCSSYMYGKEVKDVFGCIRVGLECKRYIVAQQLVKFGGWATSVMFYH